MDRMELKRQLLKMLSDEMKQEMRAEKGELFKDVPKKIDKVTVASDSPEGLLKGLDKAEEFMKKKLGMSEEMEDKMEDESEEMEDEMEEGEEMDKESLMAKLLKKKA